MITHQIIDIRQWTLRNAAPKYFIDSRLSSIQSTSRLSEAKLPDNRAVTTSPPDPHKMVSGTWCPPWARNQCNWSPEPCFWWQPDQQLYWCIHVPTVHTFSELELVWKRRNKSLSTYENKFRAYLLLLWAWRTESERLIRNQLCQCWYQKQPALSDDPIHESSLFTECRTELIPPHLIFERNGRRTYPCCSVFFIIYPSLTLIN